MSVVIVIFSMLEYGTNSCIVVILGIEM
jgi:hypothetical protein